MMKRKLLGSDTILNINSEILKNATDNFLIKHHQQPTLHLLKLFKLNENSRQISFPLFLTQK